MQMSVCACVCSLNNDELGNRIRLLGLLSSPWAPSCTITSQGHVPGLYCSLSAAHFSSVPSPFQRVLLPFSMYTTPPTWYQFQICSGLLSTSLRMMLKCLVLVLNHCQPRLRWGDRPLKSEHRDPVPLQAHSSISSMCGCKYTLLKALPKLSNICCSSLLHRVCHLLKEIKYQQARHNLSCKFPLSHFPSIYLLAKSLPLLLSACGLKTG